MADSFAKARKDPWNDLGMKKKGKRIGNRLARRRLGLRMSEALEQERQASEDAIDDILSEDEDWGTDEEWHEFIVKRHKPAGRR